MTLLLLLDNTLLGKGRIVHWIGEEISSREEEATVVIVIVVIVSSVAGVVVCPSLFLVDFRGILHIPIIGTYANFFIWPSPFI